MSPFTSNIYINCHFAEAPIFELPELLENVDAIRQEAPYGCVGFQATTWYNDYAFKILIDRNNHYVRLIKRGTDQFLEIKTDSKSIREAMTAVIEKKKIAMLNDKTQPFVLPSFGRVW